MVFFLSNSVYVNVDCSKLQIRKKLSRLKLEWNYPVFAFFFYICEISKKGTRIRASFFYL